jgi:hypothetical protein
MPRSIAALLLLLPVGALGSATLTGCNRTGAAEDAGRARATPVASAPPPKMGITPTASPTAPTGGPNLTLSQRVAAQQKRLFAGLARRGVTEKTEQRIYWEAEAPEERAKSEARRNAGKSGPPEAQREHALEQKYRRQLLLRYRASGLTEEEMNAIISHGDEERWPAPGRAGTAGDGHPG